MLTTVSFGLSLNLEKCMDVRKCILLLWHGSTLNCRQAASPLVRLVEEEERNNKSAPIKKINISDLVIPQGVVLADEGFNQPSENLMSDWQ
ncbi:hypothetical protein TNCV_1476981 [Trichonephila clavipes]|nr:hypothetical protein TNCV_1476981 [Trichonephila clavipes]